MPCTAAAPPDVVIEISVAVPPNYPKAPLDAKFSLKAPPADSGIHISEDGDLKFHRLSACVRVKMEITNGYTFYQGNDPNGRAVDALSFSDDPDDPKAPVAPGSSFLDEISGIKLSSDRESLQFDYKNWSDHGNYKYSGFGIYIANADGTWLGELDPIVSNGGNTDTLKGHHRRSHIRHRHHHHHR